MVNTLRIGAAGEKAATEYVRHTLGYTIAELNWRSGHHEVDIIAISSDGHYHFVEVKTRKFGTMTAPEEAINEQKMRAMRRAASAYMAQHRCNLEPRFSLIAVEMIGERVESLRFVEDALEYGW